MNEAEANPPSAEIRAGGVPTSIDLTSEKDRALVRNAMRSWPKRWRGLSEEFKEQCVKDLRAAGDTARAMLTDEEKAESAIKAIASIVKTATVMEAQNQADEHMAEKYARIDAGLATDSHDLKLYGKDAPTDAV